MEELQLSEPEQRYFSDLFLLCCNGENLSSVPVVKACELFRTSKLANDVIRQITDLCSCNKSSELERDEFYMALKLIAAAQAGLPLSSDTMNNAVVLPRFTWPSDEQSDLIQLSDPATTTAAASAAAAATAAAAAVAVAAAATDVAATSTAGASGKHSPSASSTASDSPTPTNSVQDKGWAAAAVWQGMVCEEQRQLLGTEEESSDRHSSSEETEPESIWTITDEQRKYYTTQFESLQPKPSGMVPGPVARLFFEKSRLPVQELRQIWQLADVTKDGALSLEEFNVAMHLVVLRRYQIPLPDSLPSSLMPALPPPKDDPPPSPGQVSVSSETTSNKQWTKFVDSPTSSIASPGPKPVNFDFHKSAVEQDPRIFHPVPLRVTPEHNLPNAESDRADTDAAPLTENHAPNTAPNTTTTATATAKKILLQSHSTDNADIRPIQRPTPRKPAPGPGAIPPPPHVLPDDLSGPTSLPVMMVPKKEPPPPPPPRPYRTHARSSSLDLNHIGRSNSLHAPPAPPPRTSPNSTSPKRLINQRSEGDGQLAFPGSGSSGSAGFPGGEDEGIAEVDGAPRRHGAFHVYRKHANHSSPSEGRIPCKQTIRRLEVQNSALALLCLQLNQELIEIQEERILLQVELEKLQARYDI